MAEVLITSEKLSSRYCCMLPPYSDCCGDSGCLLLLLSALYSFIDVFCYCDWYPLVPLVGVLTIAPSSIASRFVAWCVSFGKISPVLGVICLFSSTSWCFGEISPDWDVHSVCWHWSSITCEISQFVTVFSVTFVDVLTQLANLSASARSLSILNGSDRDSHCISLSPSGRLGGPWLIVLLQSSMIIHLSNPLLACSWRSPLYPPYTSYFCLLWYGLLLRQLIWNSS